jgi:hypothetical protein
MRRCMPRCCVCSARTRACFAAHTAQYVGAVPSFATRVSNQRHHSAGHCFGTGRRRGDRRRREDYELFVNCGAMTKEAYAQDVCLTFPCDFFRPLIDVRFSNGSELAVGTAWGPGANPRPVSCRPGKFPSGRKEEISDYICNRRLDRDQSYHGFVHAPHQAEVSATRGRLSGPEPQLQYITVSSFFVSHPGAGGTGTSEAARQS